MFKNTFELFHELALIQAGEFGERLCGGKGLSSHVSVRLSKRK